MRILGFLGALAAVFGVAYACGDAVEPIRTGPTEHGAHDSRIAGYTVTMATKQFGPGRQELAFGIEKDGEPVTSYDVAHEKRLHLILVREDFSGFQHLHPDLDGDFWRTAADLTAGQWRMYADFTPTGDDAQVLAPVLSVDGPGTTVNRRDTVRTVRVDGYEVTLRGTLQPGGTTVLRPSITRDGRAVADLEPYLGALGHLVALRHETYDYLHVHPEGLDFHTTVERPGTYELYLQFQHRGTVHTARFTLTAQPQPDDAPTGVEHGEHDGH